jgi:methylmalonyl-CoA mutase N-terminal domain/subunit
MALTAQQPVNNVVRGSLQALAMALAGVQAMEVSAFDEAFRTPSPQAHEVALRTQQIIHLESNVTQVADPLGGSYFLEALTDEIERRIRAMVEQVEGLGEPAALAERGWFRSLFQNAMERHARALADGSLPKVGVNCHVVPEEEDTLLREVAELKIEPYVERIDAIRRHREERDAGRVQESLAALRARAEDRRANLTPAVIAAFEAGATMGEMAEVLRLAYGWPADPWLEGPLGEAASA